MKIMVTGGCGFIGSNFVHYWLKNHPFDTIYVIDCLTYASNQSFISDLPVRFLKADIRDQRAIAKIFDQVKPDHLFHFAAESHVCRSITGPKDFITTNILGTFNLLEEWQQLHQANPMHSFIHISTDEVFGSLSLDDPSFNEASLINPNSPYAASKASSDLIGLAYHRTYKTPVILVNCSNNFGPHQHQEKLIPAAINSFMRNAPVKIFNPGTQIRDWLYVGDCVKAIEMVFHRGVPGERYCIGGENEISNLVLIERLHHAFKKVTGSNDSLSLIFSDSRPTDDFRYSIDNEKIKQLGWQPRADLFDQRLEDTIKWYLEYKGAL